MVVRRLTIGLEENQVKAIEALMFEQGRAAAELVRSILDEYLIRHEEQISQAQGELAAHVARQREKWGERSTPL